MPSPIPAPLPPWAKALIQVTPFVSGYLYDLLTHAGDMPAPPNEQWRRLQVKFDNLTTTDPADDQYITFDLANITGGTLDSTWNTADYTTCETLFNNYLTSIQGNFATSVRAVQYRWYKRQFNPYDIAKPFADMGPPERVTTISVLGGATTPLPPQVAISVTEKTAFPKHWGRFYLPQPGASVLGVGGVLLTANADSICTATQTLYAALATAEFPVVVPITQIDKSAARGLITVNQIQVDNTLDVIRRRRYAAPTYRKVLP